MFCASIRYFQQISYFPFPVSHVSTHTVSIRLACDDYAPPANIDCRHPSPTSAIHTIVARTQCGIHPSSCQQSQMLWVNKTSFEYWVDTSTCLLWNVDNGRYRYFDHWTVLQILNSVSRLRAPGSRRTWRCRGWRWSGGRRGWRACPAGCSGPRGPPSAGSRATGIRFN